MKNFFKKMLGMLVDTPSNSAPNSGRDNPSSIVEGSENATRRQLVQVLTKDVLRRSGIPHQWVDCQMLVVASRSRGPGMYVRLVVKQWDARLMTYAFAFQKALLADIVRFDPKAVTWLHGISWQLEMASTCPYPSLPDKSFWRDVAPSRPAALNSSAAPLSAQVTAKQQAPVVMSVQHQKIEPPKPEDDDNSPAKDLEALFAIRDQELSQKEEPTGYEKTQPSPL